VQVEWVIQADDLTGAADSAVGFAAAGLPTVVLPWRDKALAEVPEAAVVAFDTASRDVDAHVAADRAGAVARWFARYCDDRAWMYKKIDSTLRGNVAAEVAAVERELSPSRVVVAPAFPALGRTTVEGRQRWDGGEVDVAALLGRVVVDAERTEDLDALAGELEALPERPLLVGSGGLAAAHARRRGSSPPAVAPGSGPVLVVSGSRTALAARQAERLAVTRVGLGDDAADPLSAGEDVLLTGPAGALGLATARALRNVTPRLVIVVGGDTAHAVCTALGIAQLRAEREAAPGAPLLRCTLADGRELRLVFKSGSFGDDDALARLVA
jgi:D-threonate/D-erythronate kinase